MSDQQQGIAIVALCAAAILAIWLIYYFSTKDKPEPKSNIKLNIVKVPVSWAAGQLKLEFSLIPAKHRPDADIDSVVRALDTKHTVTDVNNHFRRVSGQLNYTWEHSCHTQKCPYREYIDLHLQFVALNEAYEKQQHALAVAEQQYGFEQMDSLSQQLVNETLSLVNSAHDIREGGSRAREAD